MSSRLARMAAIAVLAMTLMAGTAHAATPSAYVYSTSSEQAVLQYSADDAGALTPLEPSRVDAGSTSKGAVATPDGRHLYVSNEASNDISQYAIAGDGTLTPLEPATVGAGTTPFGLAVSPDGAHVYVADQDDNAIRVYNVAADGTLTEASSRAAETKPVQVTLSPDGRSAYATNSRSATVSQYDVAEDGSLSPKTPASVPAGPTPVGIAVSPDGANAYVADQVAGGTVAQFSIAANGTLSPLTSAFVDTGSLPEGVLATADGVYVANLGDNTISQYDALPGGALRAKPAGAVASPDSPFGLALAPDCHSVYVAGFGAAAVGQYDVGSDGALSAKTPPSVGAGVRPIAVVAVRPRDVQAPTVDLRTPAEGAQYTLGEQVAADYSCADEGGSGVASCTGDVPDGDPLSTATLGDNAFTVVARDGAGNETTATHHYTVVAAPDEQAPTVDLDTPSQGAQYDVSADVHTEYSCADEGGSGLASCTGDVPDGDPLSTATPGAYDFTVVARDGAGHETTVTHSYTVVQPPPPPPDLGFAGFFGSIQDGSVVHAGAAISIVFGLDGYHGLKILATGSPTSVQVDCQHPGHATGGEAARSAPGRGLRYNRRTGHYVFNWQTKTAWARTCRTFVLSLNDGSVERLTVSFRPAWRWGWGWHR
jgi:DNA-binding beta-propeller fold protein YncE